MIHKSGNFAFQTEVRNGRVVDNRPTLPGFERPSSEPKQKPRRKTKTKSLKKG